MKHFFKICAFLLISLPAVSLGEDGESLYADNCAICHGNEGTGGVGIPLALPSFLEQVPDEYLRRTIRIGRSGRIMPSFYWMSDTQIDKIIAHIRGWGKTKAAPWDESPILGDSQRGKKHYDQFCVTCHGKDAIGGRGTGLMFSRPRDLPITAPALSNQGFLNSATDQMMKNIITHGRKETPMPPASSFGLKEGDVNDIVSYLRSFQLAKVSRAISLDDEPASLIYDSPYNFEETIDNTKRAIIGSNFRLIREQALDDGLVAKGKESKRQWIIYFCNFNFLYEALTIDPRVGLFLPCRITIVEQNGKVQLMSINPKQLSRLYNNHELDLACNEMYDIYTSILEDATL